MLSKYFALPLLLNTLYTCKYYTLFWEMRVYIVFNGICPVGIPLYVGIKRSCTFYVLGNLWNYWLDLGVIKMFTL